MNIVNIKDNNNLFLLEQLVKKNFSSKYKDSYLGILWSVLRPLFMMIILTIIFSTMFSKSIPNYPVYLLAGRTLFRFFVGACGSSMGSLKGNKHILLQNPVPKYIFVLATVISAFIDLVISVLLLTVVMVATNAPFYFSLIPLSIFPIISLLMMVIGVSLILSVISVYYSDIQHLWGVFTQILLYSSAIFYPLEIIPQPYRQYIMLNPLLWTIDQFRHFIVFGDFPNSLNMFNSFVLSLIILIFGIIVFAKYSEKIVIKF